MSKRTPRLLLEDIQESAEKILSYTKDLTFEEFSVDNKTIDAVIRNFEIIGEAANRLSKEARGRAEIPWNRIIAFRNRLIQG